MSGDPSTERCLGVLEGKMNMVLSQQQDLLRLAETRHDQMQAIIATQHEHKTYFKILAAIVGVLMSFFTYDNLIQIFKKFGGGT